MSQGFVHLLRHGETKGGARYWGRTDVPLSTKGLHQMDTATRGQSWDLIVSSPLQRCRAFAELFARRRRLPLTIEPRLAEMHFGTWEGLAAADILCKDPERLSRFWRDPRRNPPPDGERLDSFAARVRSAWYEIVRAAPMAQSLVVTHGGPIRIILSTVKGLPLGRLLDIEVEHASLHPIPNDCIGRISELSKAGA